MTSPKQEPPHVPSAPGATDASLAQAGVVHDVNQMLAVITGRAGLLLKQVESPELARHLQAILLASADAAVMLRRLDTGGPESGLGATGVSLYDAAEQARLLVWPTAVDGLAWDNTVDRELRTTVPGQVLREVLSNIILNAVAVMPDGGTVTVSAEQGASGRVMVRLADTGPGLPGDDPEQVFVRGVTASGQQGRGIGLAGCRQLLAGVGGVLSAESDPAAGAIFVLDLPGSREAVSSTPQTGAESPADLPPMTVLVVDDEGGVREMLQDVLNAWGCQTQLCRDADTALAEYKTGTAEVALIDLNLPGVGGLELANHLRNSDPLLSIVVVTGWQHADELSQIDPATVDLKAHKPLELDSIRAILAKGYQLHETRRAAAASQ